MTNSQRAGNFHAENVYSILYYVYQHIRVGKSWKVCT